MRESIRMVFIIPNGRISIMYERGRIMKRVLLPANRRPITAREKEEFIREFTRDFTDGVERVLILPPDYTRKHCGAGELTALFYKNLEGKDVDIMPTLGTHDPMSNEKIINMFGKEIPLDRFIIHDWRNDTEEIGVIPEVFVSEITGGRVKQDIRVKVNKRLLDNQYDLIISIGQVLPHEVVGMANYNKNVFVGCGGAEIINVSHFIGAVSDMEKIMGKDHSPPRKLYDYAEKHFLNDLPLVYVLTVNSTEFEEGTDQTRMMGIFAGDTRDVLEEAIKLSQEVNIIKLEKPLKKVVVYLDEEEFNSTWLGNKAIYRTRMAIADGGELIIMAPGLTKFGEDCEIDKLIRKYGYVGTEKILKLVEENEDLKENLSAAAHLIHGSSEGRFKITYACQHLSAEEIRGVNFDYLPLDAALAKYNPEKLKTGFNNVGGEEVYYIDNPATGLWATADRF